tara:strand:- start:381 stop:818 length:438 start_codon:yes stop_codon:yes gene_type:complete
MVEKVKITYQGKSKNVPKSYIGTLKGKEKKAQVKSIIENKDRPKTSAKSKQSTWTIKFNKKYEKQLENMKGGKSKRNISKVTGIPFKAIDEVFKKGEAAYFSAGSKPNQTPQSWARARLYSYILGGGARKVDASITKKYNVKFPK